MSDRRTTVDMDPDDPSKVRVVIRGLSCSVFSILSRDEALALTVQLAKHLVETEEQ